VAAQRGDYRLHAGGCAGLRAIQLLPSQELAGNYGRDELFRRGWRAASGSLMTLLAPDWLGAISSGDQGSGVAPFYFYAGLLALPLAAIGAVKSGVRLPGLLLIVPPAWYMLGPAGGLYYLGALAPSLHQPRALVEGWFLVALGLALLAAAGGEWIFALWRWRFPYLPFWRPAFCSWMSGIGTRSGTRWPMPAPASMKPTARAKKPAARAWP